MRLVARLIIEESLEGEAAEALGREPSPHPNPFIQQEPDLTPILMRKIQYVIALFLRRE